ncbi:MAG: response regulator [Gammaproteobacteria bacterium]|nr:response regulator [Gammaproteobacteria bacterium]
MSEENIQKPRLLVIDDEPFFLNLLTDALADKFQIALAKNGKQGLRRASGSIRPDLILLDVVMPEMDGYETCKALKENAITSEIPIIFLTAKCDIEDELKGFNLGAADYITKPISLPILMARVEIQLAISERRIALEELVQQRTKEIEKTKDAIVYSMGEMAEARDKETGNHLLRTREYVGLLAKQLAKHPNYESRLTERLINAFKRAAPLHDIGKINIPDKILQKPDKLDSAEWDVMVLHSTYGKDAIENAEQKIGTSLFIKVAKEIAWSHHEKWDGSGYPQGLSGNDIPLSAQLMAVADVYDALVSRRYYKSALSHEETVKKITEGRGTHFAPDVIDAFTVIHSQFREIQRTLGDD